MCLTLTSTSGTTSVAWLRGDIRKFFQAYSRALLLSLGLSRCALSIAATKLCQLGLILIVFRVMVFVKIEGE
jgi:hypothetical protein